MSLFNKTQMPQKYLKNPKHLVKSDDSLVNNPSLANKAALFFSKIIKDLILTFKLLKLGRLHVKKVL